VSRFHLVAQRDFLGIKRPPPLNSGGTLTGASGKTAYICGFNVSAVGGTAAVGPITIAGLIGSSMVYQLASSTTDKRSSLTRTATKDIDASSSH
jgi:hypothetical protein